MVTVVSGGELVAAIVNVVEAQRRNIIRITSPRNCPPGWPEGAEIVLRRTQAGARSALEKGGHGAPSTAWG